MTTTIRDGAGHTFRDVEEYDETTGSITYYLHDEKGERLRNDMGRFVTFTTKRPKPLTPLEPE